MSTLTQDLLLEFFEYNPDTGSLINKINRGVAIAGQEAGGITTFSNGMTYRQLSFNNKCYQVHRLIHIIMTGEEAEIIDHINGDGTDNRWCNLKNGTQADNTKNRRKCSRNTSGIVGVGWNKALNKWVASITIKRKSKHLGYFTDFDEAVKVRKAAEKEYGFHENHGRDGIITDEVINNVWK